MFSICCSATQPPGPSEGRSVQRVQRDSFMELLKSLFLWTVGSGLEGRPWLSVALDCLLCSVVRRHITYYPLSCSSGSARSRPPRSLWQFTCWTWWADRECSRRLQTCLEREHSTARPAGRQQGETGELWYCSWQLSVRPASALLLSLCPRAAPSSRGGELYLWMRRRRVGWFREWILLICPLTWGTACQA